MKNHISAVVVALSSAALLVPGVALAGGGHGGGHASFWDLKWFLLNFTLYVVILYVLLRKQIATGWVARRDRLAAEVSSRAVELQAAEVELRDAELRLQAYDGEVRNLRTQIARETEHEAAQIAAEAARRAERIHTQTNDSLRAERRAAEGGIQRALADLVIRRAEEKLKSELSSESDRPLRDRALSGAKQLVQQ